MKKILKYGLWILLAIFICGGMMYSVFSSSQKRQLGALVFYDIDTTALKDGYYQGEAEIDFIRAKVEVEIKDQEMVAIDVLEYRHIFGYHGEDILVKMVEEHRLDVDTIAGATLSSEVLRCAVNHALYQAMQDR